MAIVDRVRELVTPIVEAESIDLYDIEHTGGTLRIFVDHRDGVDIEVIKRVSRGIGNLLDEVDPIPGRYTLEVSSPGLERSLRTPAHFHKAVGSQVKIKTRADADGDRRVHGVLLRADDDGVDVDTGDATRHLRYGDIVKARTVFELGPTPKPGGRAARRSAGESKSAEKPKSPEKKAPTS
jgi:ribosome maturation factor RimP